MRRFSTPEIRLRASSLVNTLLFNDNYRVSLYNRQLAELEEQRTRAWQKYTRTCRENKQVVNFIQQMIVDSNVKNSTLLIPTGVKADLQRETYYTSIIMEMYEKVCRHTKQVKIDVVALGVALLYAMRVGKSVQEILVLSIDPYLIRHLPQLDFLPYFALPKNKLSKGTKILNEFYKTCLSTGLERGEMLLTTQPEEPAELFTPTVRHRFSKNQK